MAIEPPSLNRASGAAEQWRLVQPDDIVSQPAARRGKILIVDGCAENRRSLRTMLGEIQHELSEASTTSEAIGAISLHRVDLVLIDVATEELGAVEFCRMLKKASATQFLPVFVTAARDDLESEVLAIEAGADEFLVAPLRPRAFLARVQASLRHKAMIDSLDDSETVLFSLAQSVEERDPDLGQHCQRLALMAAAMGLALELPSSDILALQRGGYLHDVGKVAIPDHILFKPGPLTPEEWEVMKTHAERGARISSSMRSLAQVLPIIRHHHERWDGSGYPDKLKGEQIPLLARILQMADIYDALTSERPYKRPYSPGEAISLMKQETARGWRDPLLMPVVEASVPLLQSASFWDAAAFAPADRFALRA